MEDDADPLSLALAVEGTYRPSWDRTGYVFRGDCFGVRGGLDLSRSVGADGVLVLAPAVSFGPEAHAIGATSLGATHADYGPGAVAYATRRELRIHSALGVGTTTEGVRLLFCAVPYWISWAVAPLE